ncbi:MAG: hypothetical protein EPN49_16060 [Rhodanobacter sp.]|nr:MAG: hypothetical protein EPN49_16060 [Rhodanobacter sp.]
MAHRLIAGALLVGIAAFASGCAEPPARDRAPVVHHPLMYRYYLHDVVAPRPPPPFVVEPVRLRRGYVWAHSYWRWDGHDFVPVPSHWVPQKPGYRYADARWEAHRDGWHFHPAHWLFL